MKSVLIIIIIFYFLAGEVMSVDQPVTEFINGHQQIYPLWFGSVFHDNLELRLRNDLRPTLPPIYREKCPPNIPPCSCNFDDTWDLHFTCKNFENITQVKNYLKINKGLVKSLEIIHPSISELPRDIFQEVCLGELILELPLLDIPDSIFVSQTRCLENLNINTGIMEKIPINALIPLRRLKKLTFINNRIVKLKDPLWKLSLPDLNLDNNYIAHIDSNVFPRSLKTLSLKNNHLKSLNGSLLHLTDLKELFLTNNSIKNLQNELTTLKNLENLKADMNNLTHLADALYDLNKLKVVDLSRNRLEGLYFGFHFVPNLEEVDVSNNLITIIPKNEFVESKKLRKLSLAYNRISSLNLSLEGRENLQNVSLKGNRIHTLEKGDFHAINLEIIDLSYNLLSKFPFGTFPYPSKLREISLAHNQLKYLPSSFSYQTLRTLYLDGNPLLCEIYECFSRLKKLGMNIDVIKHVRAIHVDEPNYVIRNETKIGFGNEAFIWKLYTVY